MLRGVSPVASDRIYEQLDNIARRLADGNEDLIKHNSRFRSLRWYL